MRCAGGGTLISYRKGEHQALCLSIIILKDAIGNARHFPAPRMRHNHAWTLHTGSSGSSSRYIVKRGNLFSACRSTPSSKPNTNPQGVVLKAIFPKNGGSANVRLAAGSWNSGVTASSGDGGKAVSAVMAYPKGVAIDADDVVYVAEFQGEKIRRVSTTGMISTVAGTGSTVRAWGGLHHTLTSTKQVASNVSL